MTREEIDQKIEEYKKAIKELEGQRDAACPFDLPVKITQDYLIFDEKHSIVIHFYSEVARLESWREETAKYIAHAINAYPAHEALREFVEAMEESEALVALDKREYEMWCKALAAMEKHNDPKPASC